MTWKTLSFLAVALPLWAVHTLVCAQDEIRNATDFTDKEYERFKKTLVDRPAWEQLQADFLAWKAQYPLRYTDRPALHLIEGTPVVSLQVGEENIAVIEENRRAGVIRICKLIFKNKRYDQLQITFMDRDRPDLTHGLAISKESFLELYRNRELTHKLMPSQKQSIEERSGLFQALQDSSLEDGLTDSK